MKFTVDHIEKKEISGNITYSVILIANKDNEIANGTLLMTLYDVPTFNRGDVVNLTLTKEES